LGSFGDNELSPECLDGCQHVIKPNGISIPTSYTSFLAPISSSKIFGDVIQFDDLKHIETPYVVKFRQTYNIAEPQPTWTFDHPHDNEMASPGTPGFNMHNIRYSHTSFTAGQNAVMHGIAGYFDCKLYKDVHISINPPTHSPDMFSWFPLFFPIRVPLYVPKGTEIDIHFWRCSDARKVWYEWQVVPRIGGVEVVGEASSIHNPGGRSSWIGL
jgi:type II protein arginine methyltransferase